MNLNPFRQSAGNLVDRIGTKLNLPDVGLSELFAGGKSTTNTGNQPIVPISNVFRPSDTYQVSTNTAPGQILRAYDMPMYTGMQIPPTQVGNAVTPDVQTQQDILNAFEQALADANAEAGSSGGSTYQPDYQIFNGKSYDLNNPEDRQNFFAAKKQELLAYRDQLLAEADKNASKLTSQAKDQYSNTLSQIDQNLADIETQAKQYAGQYKEQVGKFSSDKNLGDVQRAQSFAALSPNAFQSSQATSQDYANEQYLKGLGDLAASAESAVGSRFLDTGNVADLAAGSSYGRGYSSAQQQRAGLGNAYEDYLKSITDTTNANRAAADKYVTDNATSLSGELGKVDLAQGYNPFSYNVSLGAPAAAPVADLSQYTPYTTAQSLNTVPSSPSGGYRGPVASNPFNQNSIDSYLGRSGVTDAGQKSFLTKYLMGKSGY